MEKIVRISQWRYIKIIMESFLTLSLITIVGSMVTLVLSLPFGSAWQMVLKTSGISSILTDLLTITSDCYSLYLVFVLAVKTAQSFDMPGIQSGVIALIGFLVLVDPVEYGRQAFVIPKAAGAEGICLAILTGITVGKTCCFIYGKYKEKRHLPAVLAALLIWGVCYGVMYGFRYTRYDGIQGFIYTFLQTPLIRFGGGFKGIFMATFLGNLFWLFGVHGGNLVFSFHGSVFQILRSENISAFAQGLPAPHPEWFMNAFIAIGGMGCTLALNLLMVFGAKSRKLRDLGRISLPMSLFEINESLIFGLPIVANPILGIPFILCPCMNLILSYLVMVKLAVLAPPTGAFQSFFLPFGIYGALTTGSISGLAWSVILLAMDIFIYYPFFRAYDKKLCMEEGIEDGI